MASSIFETTRPDDYLLRLAASDLGRGFKQLALAELRITPGQVVLDLGCGPGTDLSAYADATGADGRVIGHQATDSQGTITTYGPDGRAISRATPERKENDRARIRQGFESPSPIPAWGGTPTRR